MSNAIQVCSDFPGGNIVIKNITDNVVTLETDWSTSSSWWFWWYFKASAAPGTTVTFQFDVDLFSAAGPCQSYDGDNWNWLGAEAVSNNSFTFEFTEEHTESFFAFSIPYLEKDLASFLKYNPTIKRSVLALSEKEREIELLEIISQKQTSHVLLTARHHASECTANYVVEGICQYWANSNDPFLAEHVDLRVVPFIDKDGVELGEQGKNRIPYDHARDYGLFKYASTRNLCQQIPTWPGKAAFAMDLHSPYIKGGRDDAVFFIEAEKDQYKINNFCSILKSVQKGPIHFSGNFNIPFNCEWNNLELNKTGPAYWRNHGLYDTAMTVEIPYALSEGTIMTKDALRKLGWDMGKAISKYIATQL